LLSFDALESLDDRIFDIRPEAISCFFSGVEALELNQ
jgi:hypothetical protein